MANAFDFERNQEEDERNVRRLSEHRNPFIFQFQSDPGSCDAEGEYKVNLLSTSLSSFILHIILACTCCEK